MTTERVAFYDLPPESFPFTTEFLRDDVVVHTIEVSGPGAVPVPAIGDCSVRLRFPDGLVIESP